MCDALVLPNTQKSSDSIKELRRTWYCFRTITKWTRMDQPLGTRNFSFEVCSTLNITIAHRARRICHVLYLIFFCGHTHAHVQSTWCHSICLSAINIQLWVYDGNDNDRKHFLSRMTHVCARYLWRISVIEFMGPVYTMIRSSTTNVNW